MKDCIIYTAIIGEYDRLTDPSFVNTDFDYVCFTNGPIKSNVFDIQKVELYNNDKIRTARRFKILPHLFFKNYKYSIWIDGNILIKGNLKELINRYLEDSNISVMRHRGTTCAYKEASTCIGLHKDIDRIEKQIKKYKHEDYPVDNGLLESGFILRRHNEKDVITSMEDWWKEVVDYSCRDQISFNYVAWKNKLKFNYMMKFQTLETKKYIVLTHNHIPGRNRKW